jgi:hypothetical protein
LSHVEILWLLQPFWKPGHGSFWPAKSR